MNDYQSMSKRPTQPFAFNGEKQLVEPGSARFPARDDCIHLIDGQLRIDVSLNQVAAFRCRGKVQLFLQTVQLRFQVGREPLNELNFLLQLSEIGWNSVDVEAHSPEAIQVVVTLRESRQLLSGEICLLRKWRSLSAIAFGTSSFSSVCTARSEPDLRENHARGNVNHH